MLQTYGYVQVINNHKIIVHVPIKPEHSAFSSKPNRQVQFYFNNQLVFFSEWLPILTNQDRNKFKSMFYQIWYEYSKMIQHKYWPLPPYGPALHNEVLTIYDKPSYYLACSESFKTTSIELTTKYPSSTTATATATSTSAARSSSHTVPVHIQFYFGNNLILCSETQLPHLNCDDLHFVLSFILQKFIH